MATQVGESVNNLLSIVDDTSKLRMSKMIKRSVLAMSSVEQVITQPTPQSHARLGITVSECELEHRKLSASSHVALVEGVELSEHRSHLF